MRIWDTALSPLSFVGEEGVKRPCSVRRTVLVAALLHGACGPAVEPPPDPPAASEIPLDAEKRPRIVASNAFYYYADVEAAWRFYAGSGSV